MDNVRGTNEYAQLRQVLWLLPNAISLLSAELRERECLRLWRRAIGPHGSLSVVPTSEAEVFAGPITSPC